MSGGESRKRATGIVPLQLQGVEFRDLLQKIEESRCLTPLDPPNIFSKLKNETPNIFSKLNNEASIFSKINNDTPLFSFSKDNLSHSLLYSHQKKVYQLRYTFSKNLNHLYHHKKSAQLYFKESPQ